MSDRYHGLVIYLMKVICADRYVVLIKKVVLHTDIVVNTLFQQKFANIKMQSNV
jgi:hypothetical protein